jgi:hypothetical protein
MSSEQQPQKRGISVEEQYGIIGNRERPKRRFSSEEQSDIIRRAVHIHELTVTEDELIASFEQSGLRRDAIEQAIAEHVEQQRTRPAPPMKIAPRVRPALVPLLLIGLLAALPVMAIRELRSEQMAPATPAPAESTAAPMATTESAVVALGKTVRAVAIDVGNGSEIRITSLDGELKKTLPFMTQSRVTEIVLSPNERRIAFITRDEVGVVNADGTNLAHERNLHTPGNFTDPSWSTDDRLSFYCAAESKRHERKLGAANQLFAVDEARSSAPTDN